MFQFDPRRTHCKVLDEISKKCNASSSGGFPVSQQYVPNILEAKKKATAEKAAAAKAEDPGAGAAAKEPAVETKQPTKPTTKRPVSDENVEDQSSSKTVWKYAEFRNEYIRVKMKEGFSHKESCNLWDESLDKAKLLANVSIGEMKRRKFLKKGTEENPWWKRLQNLGDSSLPQ